MPVAPEKIADALKLLDEAAQNQKDELKKIACGKFDNLKDALVDEHNLREKLAAAGQKAAEIAKQLKETSEVKAKELAGAVDENVRKNPWPYIGGVAVGALLLGFILGRKTS
ncbi:MAG: hypothetical protein QXH80_01020 [Candidatus Nanoarchaeia archaeon]